LLGTSLASLETLLFLGFLGSFLKLGSLLSYLLVGILLGLFLCGEFLLLNGRLYLFLFTHAVF